MKLIMNRYDYPSIQNLGLCIAFTNSELMSLTCSRKYSFEYVDCIETNKFSYPMFFGVCWHFMCENALLEIKYNDEVISYEKLENILEVKVSQFIRDSLDQYEYLDKEEIFEKVYENIKLGMYGWLDKWSKEIHPFYRVVDVEKELIKPIIQDGEKLKVKTKYIKEDFQNISIIRNPLVGELHKNYVNRYISCGDHNTRDSVFSSIIEKEVPVYKVGKLDCILLERETGSLWILDHKTSGNPVSYARKMQFDLQLYSYASLLDYAIKNGEYKFLGNVFIGGIIWDICSSKYNKPSFDKDGALKQVKRGFITHSLAKKILKHPRYEMVENEYDDYLEILKNRDSSNYLIIKEIVSDRDIKRINYEDIANSKKLIALRNDAYGLDCHSDSDRDIKLPRYPVCLTYNFCSYERNCSDSDSFSSRNLLFLDRKAKQYWIVDSSEDLHN
jgi:hypothetical protein